MHNTLHDPVKDTVWCQPWKMCPPGGAGQAKGQGQAAVEACPLSGVDRCEEDEGQGTGLSSLKTLLPHGMLKGHGIVH